MRKCRSLSAMELFYSHPYLSMRTLLLWCCVHVILFSALELQEHAHGCLPSERDGLLRLKAQFNPNDSYLPSWNVDVNVDCCKWEQISCDSLTSRVTAISLTSMALISKTKRDCWSLNASTFLPFEDLQILNLGSNKLKGLEGLPRLGKLKSLDLSLNCFTGIPSVHVLPSLKILDLKSNYLSDWDDLAEVTALKELEFLNLAYNGFSGNIPPFIGDLISLKSLSFGMNYFFGGSDYDEIDDSLHAEVLCRLKNLEELDLSGIGFEGSLPLCLSELTSLRVLDLHDNNFKGSIPQSLFSSLNSIEYVSLSSNIFEGSFSFSSFANNPNLEVFELMIYNANSLEVDTESPPGWIPLFQLKILRLSNCALNKPIGGAVPSFLLMQYQLKLLNLDNTGVKGDFLSWLLGNNTSLEYVSLSNNSLQGTLDLNPGLHYPHLSRLDVSSNHISGEIPLLIGSAMPNLRYLNLSGNALRGPIPHSVGEMRNLISLDLSNNYLSREVPASLAVNCVSLRFLILSNNSFQGRFPLASNLVNLWALRLDNNNFTDFTEGLLKSGGLGLLDAKKNALSGKIPNWIGNLKVLRTLVLSKNFLEGHVPMSICNMSSLTYLDLSHNHLGPSLPPCSKLPSLIHFHMQNNQLKGPIPYVLSQASSLVTLELSHNELSGQIPSWFAASLPNLRILLLKGNILHGPIPFSLCVLRNISILDFSNNSLSGSLPLCLGDMLLGREHLFDGRYNGREFGWGGDGSLISYSHMNQLRLNPIFGSYYLMHDENDLVQFVTKRRDECYEGNILYYMSGLDLSCNKLEGPISPAIGFLTGIHTLNLSHNYLSGSIPDSFYNLEQIESLDLSHNILSGEIPTQLLGLNFLSVFSVAYNNLSGMTPKMVGQFSTFDSSSYEGNPRLYGPPLKTKKIRPSHINDDNEKDEGDFEHEFWFSFAGSSLVLFLVVCGYFYLNSYHLEAMLGFISIQLSRVPYCASLAKLLEVRRNVSIRFVLDSGQKSGASNLHVKSRYRCFKNPRLKQRIGPFPTVSLQLT